nr:MAG TPA_asm: hypothetical protein [Caudoviricetes sp.]
MIQVERQTAAPPGFFLQFILSCKRFFVSLFFPTVFLCFLIFPHVFRYLIVVCGCSSLCFFCATC